MKHTENFLNTYEARMEHEDSFALGLELMFLALADLLIHDEAKEVPA